MNRVKSFRIITIALLVLATVLYLVYAYLFPNPSLEMQAHDNRGLQADTIVGVSGQSISAMTGMAGSYVSVADSSELFFVNGSSSGTTGKFKDFKVTISTDGPLESVQIEAVIESKSVYTFNEIRDSHLQDEDFFNTKNFPMISFQSTEIEQTDTAYLAMGSMQFLGVENEIVLPFKYLGSAIYPEGNVYHVLEGGFVFNPGDYGMDVGLTIADVSEVKFHLEVEELK